MKRYKLTSLLLFLLFAGFFASCTDDWDDILADPVDKFLGNWKANEMSSVYGGPYVYNVTIARNPGNSAEILISNFYMQGWNEKARALVTGNSFTIMQQTICDGTITIKGSGQFSGGKITLTYSANDGADLDNVTATYEKR